MSKNSPVQAAALNTPTKKIEPTKALANKPASAKPTVSKTAVTKAVVAKPATSASPTKVAPKKVVADKVSKLGKIKTSKLKMERDSFTMPKAEYAQFSVLKERLAKLGQPAKKSELLRAGVMQLTAMTDAALKATMSKVPTIKTGRPSKK